MRMLLPLFMFLWLLTSCTPQTTPTATAALTAISQSSVSNDFIVWGLAGLGSEIKTYMNEIFKTAHPELNVIITDEGWDEALRQNLENAILMGRPPDIVIGENYFHYFAARGELQSLDDLIARHENDLVPA